MLMIDEKSRFQVRVAGVCVKEGRVLVQTHGAYYALPGGRVEMGESFSEALAREMMEELACVATVGRPLWLVENFFTLDGRAHHELGMYFAMDVQPERMEAEGATFHWMPVAGPWDLPFEPRALCHAIQAPPPQLVHLVHRDK